MPRTPIPKITLLSPAFAGRVLPQTPSPHLPAVLPGPLGVPLFLRCCKFSILAPDTAGLRGLCRMGEPGVGTAPLPGGCWGGNTELLPHRCPAVSASGGPALCCPAPRRSVAGADPTASLSASGAEPSAAALRGQCAAGTAGSPAGEKHC